MALGSWARTRTKFRSTARAHTHHTVGGRYVSFCMIVYDYNAIPNAIQFHSATQLFLPSKSDVQPKDALRIRLSN